MRSRYPEDRRIRSRSPLLTPPSIAHPTRTMAYEPMSRRRVRLQADLDSGEREQQSPIVGRLKPKIFEKGHLSVAYRDWTDRSKRRDTGERERRQVGVSGTLPAEGERDAVA